MAIPVHESADGTPFDRGRTFGQAQAEAVANTVGSYGRLFSEQVGLSPDEVCRIGADVGDRLGRRRPELAEEIAGIAAGSGQAEVDLLAINARIELMAGTPGLECSVLASRTGTGTVSLAQNWDFHPSLRDSLVVWVVRSPPGKGWFVTLTEAGMLGKIGLNSSGVGVCLNLLTTSVDGGPPKTPIHVLLRLILERAASVEDAVALLGAAEVSGSAAITVADRHHVCTVEVSPGGAAVVDSGESGSPHVHTNHFLVEPADGFDTTVGEWPDTLARLRCLADAAQSDPREALASHEGYPSSVCRHDDPGLAFADRSVTLASVVMSLRPLGFAVASGNPCRASYGRVSLP